MCRKLSNFISRSPADDILLKAGFLIFSLNCFTSSGGTTQVFTNWFVGAFSEFYWFWSTVDVNPKPVEPAPEFDAPVESSDPPESVLLLLVSFLVSLSSLTASYVTGSSN